MRQQGCKMTYSHEQDRWVVDVKNHSHELHCGEGFELLLNSISIPCRIEYDHQWYVIMPGARFNLKIGTSYKVTI